MWEEALGRRKEEWERWGEERRNAGLSKREEMEEVWRDIIRVVHTEAERIVGWKMIGGGRVRRVKEWWNEMVEARWKERRIAYKEYVQKLKMVEETEGLGVTVEQVQEVWEGVKVAKKSLKEEVRKSKGKVLKKLLERGEEDKRFREQRMWKEWKKKGKGKGGIPAALKTRCGKVWGGEAVKEAWAEVYRELGSQEVTGGDDMPQNLKECGVSEGRESRLWEEVSEEEYEKARKKLVTGRAAGEDEIEEVFVKRGGEAMRTMLVDLMNSIIRARRVPEQWKIGLIVPIYKGCGDRTEPDNNREVTLLPVISKLFERIMMGRVEEESEKMGWLEEEQGGFRSGRGCTELVWMLNNVIEGRRREGKPTVVAFLDVRKAYDTVWQSGLWQVLKEEGVDEEFIGMMRDWYEGMSAMVVTPWGRTKAVQITRGVKQGSVLSPWLYSMYINGLIKELKTRGLGIHWEGEWVGAAAYADDVTLVVESKEELEAMLRVCEEYARRRRFSWAPKKCKVMGVLVEGELEVRLKGIVLERVRSFKYLGVWMQEDGKWGEMIKCRGKKGKHRLAVLAGQW